MKSEGINPDLLRLIKDEGLMDFEKIKEISQWVRDNSEGFGLMLAFDVGRVGQKGGGGRVFSFACQIGGASPALLASVLMAQKKITEDMPDDQKAEAMDKASEGKDFAAIKTKEQVAEFDKKIAKYFSDKNISVAYALEGPTTEGVHMILKVPPDIWNDKTAAPVVGMFDRYLDYLKAISSFEDNQRIDMQLRGDHSPAATEVIH